VSMALRPNRHGDSFGRHPSLSLRSQFSRFRPRCVFSPGCRFFRCRSKTPGSCRSRPRSAGSSSAMPS